MSQIPHVSKVLKQLIKQKQFTYKDLAQRMAMSEANIKRIFSTQNFTLTRLEQICELLEMNLSDLFALAQKQTQHISQLTEEQENELLSDVKLLLVAVCVRDAWTFNEITEYYEIDIHECIQLMAKLDKLKVIDLLPNNQYRSLIAQDFRWIPGGKLEQFMEQEVMIKFMTPKQKEPWAFRFYLRGRYSASSVEIIKRKLNQLTKEAAQLNLEDSTLPLNKRQHFGLLMAMRPWEPSLFEALKRNIGTES